MPRYVDPVTLEGQQLTLHAIGDADFSVRILELVAGRIFSKPVSGGRSVWAWSLTGPYLPSDLQPSHGDAETLGAAKAAFREKFDAWLAWAKELGHPVAWYG